MDFAFLACKNWASHLWMRATCLQKPARMEYHVLKVSLDVFFGTFIHFSEILNFDFPIWGKKFPSWIFIFFQLAHFCEISSKITTKTFAKKKYGISKIRISLLFRDMFIAEARNTCARRAMPDSPKQPRASYKAQEQ